MCEQSGACSPEMAPVSPADLWERVKDGVEAGDLQSLRGIAASGVPSGVEASPAGQF